MPNAFDYIEWSYLLTSLKYLGFGLECIKWIEIIYANTRASINTSAVKCPPTHTGACP